MKISNALFLSLSIFAAANAQEHSTRGGRRELGVVDWASCLTKCAVNGGLESVDCVKCLQSNIADLEGNVGANGLSAEFAFKMLTLKVPGNTYTKSWCGADTVADCDTNNQFPGGPEQTSYMKYDDVVKMGSELPQKQLEGSVWRGNELGFIVSSPYFWDKVEPKALLLGSTVPQHRSIRPIIDSIFGENGKWSQAEVEAAVVGFIAEKKAEGKMAVQNDIKKFVHKLLIKIALNRDVSDAEAQTFVDFQSKLTTFSTIAQLVPAEILGRDVKDQLFSIIGAKALRDQASAYIDSFTNDVRALYSEEIEAGINDCGSTQGGCVVQVASAILDTLFSAGGLSVPGGISTALGVLYSTDSSNPAGGPITYDRATQSAGIYYEAMRWFAPVVGFPYWSTKPSPATTEFNCEGKPCQNQYQGGVRHVMNLALANRDLRRWGRDAEEFKIRPHGEYVRNFIGFAEMAERNDVDNGRMNRNCPAKSLAIAIGKTFFKKFEQENWQLSPAADAISFSGSTPFVSEFILYPTSVKCPYECDTLDISCQTAKAHCEMCDECSRKPACRSGCRWYDFGCNLEKAACEAGKLHCRAFC